MGSMYLDIAQELARLAAMQRDWIRASSPPVRADESALLRRLVSLEQGLRADGRWTSGPVHLLDVLGLTYDEVRICRVVRWLLDPIAPHGLGGAILGALVVDLNKRAPGGSSEPIVLDLSQETYVHVEVPAADRTRADIVIENPAGTILLEAKIAAGEQAAQGARLSTMWPGATYVYLTRSGRSMKTAVDDAPWIPYRWRDLHKLVGDALVGAREDRTAVAGMARAAVTGYLEATRRL